MSSFIRNDMLISVIVPVYKVPYEKLNKCVESILNQTNQSFELILVDDGSPDECPEICDNFAKNNSKVQVIHQDNKGLSGARNSGAYLSKGDYIMFLDGDDFIDANAIERILPLLGKHEPDIVSSRHKAASIAEDIGNYPYVNEKVYSTDDELYYLKEMLLNFRGNNSNTCGKFYNKKFLDINNLKHNEVLKQGAEDIEFNFRAFSAAKSIINISDGFYNCVYNEQSITRSFNEHNEYLVVDCFKSILEHINKDDSNLIEWFYNRLLIAIIARTISGFFNPSNKIPFTKQKIMYKKYISQNIVQNAILKGVKKPLDIKRRLTLLCMRNNQFILLSIIGKIRYKQKKYKDKLK